MTSVRHAFVIMPFGKKKGAGGVDIDFDAIYSGFLAPAISAAGLTPRRADADRRGGSIHLDMFQELLLAEFVVADLTLDNPNVWYEIGLRHALRAGGSILTYAQRERLPFDIAGQRMQRYTLTNGKLDPDLVKSDQDALKEAIVATLGAWRGRRASPIREISKKPQSRDINEYREAPDSWQNRIEIARRQGRPGDILVLAEETPNSLPEFEALRIAAVALLHVQLPCNAPTEPQHVVVFSGHMVDDPAVRGVGKAKPPRFPAAKASAAATRIREALDRIGATAGDLGLCGGASGGDLLFAEACLERGMFLEVRLARSEPEYLAESVTFADPDHRWKKSFMRVKESPATTLFVMPDDLGPAPENISVHDRCNRWILYSALSQGLGKASFVTLWNGEAGDGPGGTKHMADLVRTLTGRQPEIIDPAVL